MAAWTWKTWPNPLIDYGMEPYRAWRLSLGDSAQRRWALALAGVAAWQFASGLSNVVLGWPLVAAMAHTGGAAVLLSLLSVLLMRVHQARQRAEPLASPMRGAATMSSLSSPS